MSKKDVWTGAVDRGEFTLWTPQYAVSDGEWLTVPGRWPTQLRDVAARAIGVHRAECSELAHSALVMTGSAPAGVVPSKYRLVKHVVTSVTDQELVTTEVSSGNSGNSGNESTGDAE